MQGLRTSEETEKREGERMKREMRDKTKKKKSQYMFPKVTCDTRRDTHAYTCTHTFVLLQSVVLP